MSRAPQARNLLISGVLAAAAIGLAAPANANPGQDYVYYSTLQNLGFTMWNPPLMRSQGIGVCADMIAGNNWRITMTKLMNTGYTFADSTTIMVAAVTAYCPAYSPQNQDASAVNVAYPA
jgi:hypothetical protein